VLKQLLSCNSSQFSQLQRTTSLGYQVFRCKSCHRTYNEPSDTPFNFVEVPTDIIFQVILCRVRYKLSYRDVAKFFLLRGFEFTHETVRDWEERFLPHFTEQIRTKRKGKSRRNLCESRRSMVLLLSRH
jgi:putative transposase